MLKFYTKQPQLSSSHKRSADPGLLQYKSCLCQWGRLRVISRLLV